MCVAPIRAGACNTLSHRRMPENCGDTNTISFTCLRFRSFSKGGLVFVNSQTICGAGSRRRPYSLGTCSSLLARSNQASAASQSFVLRCPIFRAACTSFSAAFSRHCSAVKIMAGLDQQHRALSGQNRPLRLPRRPYSGCRAAFFASSSVISSATALCACSSLV